MIMKFNAAIEIKWQVKLLNGRCRLTTPLRGVPETEAVGCRWKHAQHAHSDDEGSKIPVIVQAGPKPTPFIRHFHACDPSRKIQTL